MRAWLAAGTAALLFAGCGRDDTAARARAAAERARQALSDDSERALQQRVAPEQVRAAQEALSVLHEYYGDVDGALDSVTINAVQAFQRRAGLEPDGLLTPETQRRLRAAAAQARAAPEPHGRDGAAPRETQPGGVSRSTPPM